MLFNPLVIWLMAMHQIRRLRLIVLFIGLVLDWWAQTNLWLLHQALDVLRPFSQSLWVTLDTLFLLIILPLVVDTAVPFILNWLVDWFIDILVFIEIKDFEVLVWFLKFIEKLDWNQTKLRLVQWFTLRMPLLSYCSVPFLRLWHNFSLLHRDWW